MNDSTQDENGSCDVPMDPAERHFKKAWQLRRAKKLDEAITEFEASLTYQPDHPATHFNLGLVADQIGQGVKAVRHAEKARDLFLQKNDPSKQATAQRLLNKLYRKYPELAPGAS
ncbi:tetratricopeptide repeat protein [Nitrospina watsonii]|uniref:TPR_REGION domain-containing protein n=1 Tax=Nitrospina watsonii TaxID=1323948 RepID=A0ABN8VTI5_9BACT|nr:tetratricopeptide repeat protein [Nitrospina watsonii]CAI2717212.1 TPR_REGION domain-containing protein [Nitrospina watsonii]